MSENDFIQIEKKTNRDLLVAAVTHLNTLTHGQAKMNKHLEELNGKVAANVTAIAENRENIKGHNHWKMILAIVAPLVTLIGILIQCIYR